MITSASVNLPPTVADLVTEWRFDPVTAAAAGLALYAYVRARRTAFRDGVLWPWRRDLIFVVGIAAVVWTSSGFTQARGAQLMWVWTTQQLLLLLVVPVIVLMAHPVTLFRLVGGPHALVPRLLKSRPIRIIGHPLIGPILVPILCLLLFFGGLGSLALSTAPAGWLVHLLLLFVGLLIALPLLDPDDDRSSLALGMAVAIGFAELLLDAFPGIVLRLQDHLMMPYFGSGRPMWAPGWLSDQHLAGSILWTVAEVLDLPFLILVMVRWLRVDAKEAVKIDAVLDARREANVPDTDQRSASGLAADEPTADRPWWLDDPELRRRYPTE
ncbi:cytochrome c oxidase assembly factor CtaG [Antricoccus suffuscus]|uniref:Cytochrome c oxidase assembly factor CtaG n=1 Tax=Antricoccus suffuscus TaxID=1629062 RepID=A0A2T1A1M5_9ACTN|nr:cytochrome c oxidase assembly protein [Antricoccus suffuscus]PRZ42397.1 cytochrome c oxidase assembly factor CtaG [Antricoccus suffuscus]